MTLDDAVEDAVMVLELVAEGEELGVCRRGEAAAGRGKEPATGRVQATEQAGEQNREQRSSKPTASADASDGYKAEAAWQAVWLP